MSINPTIVVVCYNRPWALMRLLNSLLHASYSNLSVNLVISIDGGGENFHTMNEIANQFKWFGKKRIIANEKNLGLRQHVINCGNLTQEYDSIIILEEDCSVSVDFYQFACQALSYYQDDVKIAGISLYNYSYFESIGVPFTPLYDGYDAYFVQIPSSLGQVWSKRHWNGFADYMKGKPEINSSDLLPEGVKAWPETSWKKYFYKYIVEKDLYFVYPQISYSTNFGDIGTHFSSATQNYQVRLSSCLHTKEYNFIDFKISLNKYDGFFEILPKSLIEMGANIDLDTCIDLNGAKRLDLYKNRYALSIKDYSKPIKSYNNDLIPIPLNISKENIGEFWNYGYIEQFNGLTRNKKNILIKNQQSIGYEAGMTYTMLSKEYKLGKYVLHPRELLNLLKRKISIFVKSIALKISSNKK